MLTQSLKTLYFRSLDNLSCALISVLKYHGTRIVQRLAVIALLAMVRHITIFAFLYFVEMFP